MTADRLFDIEPVSKLTDRQQHALAVITAAGYAGVHTDELGAQVHAFSGRHAATSICQFCGQAGLEVGRALRAKGLVQQRRRRAPNRDTVTVWTVAGKLAPPREITDIWPEGF
jgi:hypothetical protein